MIRFVLIVLLLISIRGEAQVGLVLGYNQNFITGQSKDISVINGNVGVISGLSLPVKVERKQYIISQFQYNRFRYIMDGMFFRERDKYMFVITPSDFKQFFLTTNSVKLLSLYNYQIHETIKPHSTRSIYAGIGPYGEYLFSNTQRYKIGTVLYKETAPIQNKFHYGLSGELTLMSQPKGSSEYFSLSVGFCYQISQYLKSATSFKPLQAYIKIGIGTFSGK